MQTYKQPGDVIEFTAPGGGVSSGDGVKIGQLFVVACNDAAAGDPFQGMVVGVHELPRESGGGTAWSEGDRVFWDDGNSRVTTTPNSNLAIGVAAKDAADGDATGEVRLDGIARADEPA